MPSATKKTPRRRAGRPPLTRDRALAAAVALADRSGLEELSMRRLAEELGVEAMSLYHHIPNKDAILDGMVDLVFAEIEAPRPSGAWRDEMRARARSMRSALLRHPWAIRVMESRATPGPATLAHHEAVLGSLRAGGLSLRLTAHAYALLDAFIYGFAHTELSLPFQTTEETHATAASILAHFPAGAYPHFVEFARDHVLQPGYAYADEFEYGLDLLLDGLDRALARERAAGPSPAA